MRLSLSGVSWRKRRINGSGREVHGGRIILLACLSLFCGLFCGRVASGSVCCVQVGLRRTLGIKAGGRHYGGLKVVWMYVIELCGTMAAIEYVFLENIAGNVIEGLSFLIRRAASCWSLSRWLFPPACIVMLPHTNSSGDVMAHHELEIVYRVQRPLLLTCFSLELYSI